MRILIIEDEPPMVMILRKFLEPVSSRIDVTDDLASALQFSTVEKYNVVIQDLKLMKTGKAEGLAAIREFKRNGAAVVVVSGYPEPSLREEVILAGADAFVPKDDNFSKRAILMATNIATLNLPDASPKSESYQAHVELLRQMSAA